MVKVNLSGGDDPFSQIEGSLKVISEIDDSFDKREKIELDLSEVTWVLPCSIILISSKLKEIILKGAEVSYISPKNAKVKEWLSNIGFPLGKENDGSTFVSIKHFLNDPSNKNQVNEQTNSLIDSMEDKIPNNFGDSVKYILGEISDNMDDHSNFTFGSLMAQYYPKKEHLDLAILDNGITIPFNFEKNNISFEKDSDAIKKAVYGEVSTKKGEKMRGYGLRSCKDISLEGINGELHIVSRKGLLILKEGSSNFYDFKGVSLDGTFLYFRLPTPKNKVSIYPYLED
jgi:hypothetical protein